MLCVAILKNKEEGYDGRYFGTDIDPCAGYLLKGIYKDVGEILCGDSVKSLSKFKKIDLFINDSNHSSAYEYQEYQAIRGLITDSSILLSDNAHCTDRLAVFSSELGRSFLFFQEKPRDHWYPGAGIGISFKRNKI